MDKGLTTAIAANRFGLGARPGELAAIGGSGPEWLQAQLDGPAPEITGAGLQSSASILAQLYELRATIRAERMRAAAAGAAAGAFKRIPQLTRPIYLAEAAARFR